MNTGTIKDYTAYIMRAHAIYLTTCANHHAHRENMGYAEYPQAETDYWTRQYYRGKAILETIDLTHKSRHDWVSEFAAQKAAEKFQHTHWGQEVCADIIDVFFGLRDEDFTDAELAQLKTAILAHFGYHA